MHTLKIAGTGPDGSLCEIAVDGVPLQTITKLDLHLNATDVTTSTLTLIHPDGIDVETWVRITLDDATVGMLKSLGWTPPADDHLDATEGAA